MDFDCFTHVTPVMGVTRALVRHVKFVVLAFIVTLGLIFWRAFVFLYPAGNRFLCKVFKFESDSYTEAESDALVASVFTCSNILYIWRILRLEVYKTAAKKGKAPNPVVLTADGKTEVRLLDSARPGVPLVLNFGSRS